MSQTTNPFTQAASQGYDDEPEGPASPEPEPEPELDEEPEEPEEEEEEEEVPMFTQTQERSYPTAADDDESDVEEEIETKPTRRRAQIQNDSDNDEEEIVPQTSLKQFTMKKRRSEDEVSEKKVKRVREEEDDEEANAEVEDVVENIFGNDVDDVEDRDEVAAELQDLQNDTATFNDEVDEDSSDQRKGGEEEEEEEEEATSGRVKDAMYEIDLYLEKKAEQRRGNRRRGKNGDTDLSGPDADRLIKRFLDQMKVAAEEDRIFNKNRQPATAKLLLLPLLEQHLCRADLTEYFLENGVLSVFKDWLTPLPDNSLPNVKIRDALIRLLQQFGAIETEHLRSSGIGKSLMYLYKHPRETKENKLKLIKIIHDWARPIFNLTTDYKVLSREDRERRDADQASLKRQTSQSGKNKTRSADVDLPFVSKDDDDANKDDDCPRARVPRPSTRDYVNRPRSTVDISEKKGESKRKPISRLDEIKRRQQEQKRQSTPMSIVKLSVEGNRMHM